MNSIIKSWLESYPIQNSNDKENALKEIIQQIALCGLWRSKFFEHAAFYGGTALRIFYGLDRFSEDLDFSLIKSTPDFNLMPYYQAVKAECEQYGLEVSIVEKQKQSNTGIQSAFIKSDTLFNHLQIRYHRTKQLKIKLEIDISPPGLFQTETRYLLQPIEFLVRIYTIDNLFAGKMHAILCRSWKNRVKGRDWYDFIFYVKHRFPLNLTHLQERLYQSGHLDSSVLVTPNYFKQLLLEKINHVDFDNAKLDIQRFIKDSDRLNVWSKVFFKSIVDQIVFL